MIAGAVGRGSSATGGGGGGGAAASCCCNQAAQREQPARRRAPTRCSGTLAPQPAAAGVRRSQHSRGQPASPPMAAGSCCSVAEAKRTHREEHAHGRARLARSGVLDEVARCWWQPCPRRPCEAARERRHEPERGDVSQAFARSGACLNLEPAFGPVVLTPRASKWSLVPAPVPARGTSPE